ncbi:MAG TPA: MFS transporter [Solirubrobacteraceae bacterium]|nr:MFS transporter [Solirubrobacteraceae bacterium]
MRRVLARRDMRLYVAGQTLSLFGDTALWLALGVWAKVLTGSSAAAGMVMFFIAAPALLSPLSGLLVDRLPRRRLLIVANLATAAAVLPLLAVDGAGDIWLLYAVTSVYGFSYTVLGAGQSAMLATLLPADELADANAVLQTVREGLRLVAPLAGAALFTAAGGAVVALIDAATFVLAAAALACMRGPDPRPARTPERALEAVAAGARHVRDTPALRQMTIACAAALLFIGFSETLTFEVAGVGLGRDATFVGVLLAIQGVGAIAGAATAARAVRRAGELPVAGAGMLVFSLGTSMQTSDALVVVAGGLVLFGIGIPWVLVALFTLLQRLTPAGLQGRVYSAVEVLVGVPQMVSIAGGALLVTLVDYRLLLLAEAAVVAAAGAWLLTRPRQSVSASH